MIRINLLREPKAKTKTWETQKTKVPVLVVIMLILAVAVMGSWYRSVSAERGKQAQEVQQLEQEAQRLQRVQKQLEQFEKEKKVLDERVAVIEQLKANQRGPVQLMNDVIASIPDQPVLWLSSLNETPEGLQIEGRAFNVPSIATFIANLNSKPSFRRVDLEFWEDQKDSIHFKVDCQKKK